MFGYGRREEMTDEQIMKTGLAEDERRSKESKGQERKVEG